MTGGGIPVIRYDLAHYGIITSVTSPTVFNVDALASFGVNEFAGYSCFIKRKGTGSGGAPQGEAKVITASSAGRFTIAAAYTVIVAIGDEVLILHPALANASPGGQISKLAGVSLPGTHAHADDLLWQTVLTLSPTGRRKVHSIWLDFVNFAAALQTVTYRLSYQVDGATYRIFDSNAAAPWTIAMDDGVLIALESCIDHPLRLEIQKTVAEGAARDVPYEVIYEDMS